MAPQPRSVSSVYYSFLALTTNMIISYLFICWMPSHVLEHKSTEHLEPSQTLYIKWVFFCLPILTSVQAHWGQVRWVSYLSFCHGCLDLCLPGSMWLVKSGRVSLRKMSEWCSQQFRPKWADFQVTLHNWKSYQKRRMKFNADRV